MTIATLTSKGQVTLPKNIRDHLHISSGDRIDFFMDGRGEVRIKPLNKSLLALKGMLQQPGKKPVSLKQMEKAIHQGARRRA